MKEERKKSHRWQVVLYSERRWGYLSENPLFSELIAKFVKRSWIVAPRKYDKRFEEMTWCKISQQSRKDNWFGKLDFSRHKGCGECHKIFLSQKEESWDLKALCYHILPIISFDFLGLQFWEYRNYRPWADQKMQSEPSKRRGARGSEEMVTSFSSAFIPFWFCLIGIGGKHVECWWLNFFSIILQVADNWDQKSDPSSKRARVIDISRTLFFSVLMTCIGYLMSYWSFVSWNFLHS